MRNAVREFGSEFDLESTLPYITKSYAEHPLKSESAYLFRSGRDALKAVARKYSAKCKKILLPALCCESMVSPFVMNGYDIIYYRLNEDCTADCEDVQNKFSDEYILLYMSYFGVKPMNDDFLNELRQKYRDAKFVEDRTHNPLHRICDSNFKADATVISIRKWLSIADGGLLFTKENFDDDYLCDTSFADIRKDAMQKKSEFLKTGDEEIKSQFRNLLNKASYLLDVSNCAYKMTDDSKAQLKQIDFDEMLKDRQNNAKTLKKELLPLCESGKIRFISNEPENSTIYFPIVVKNRDVVQDQLAKKDIFCPVIWPLPEGAEGICENSKYIAENMLAVPCDQRYSAEDMLTIATAINEVLK